MRVGLSPARAVMAVAAGTNTTAAATATAAHLLHPSRAYACATRPLLVVQRRDPSQSSFALAGLAADAQAQAQAQAGNSSNSKTHGSVLQRPSGFGTGARRPAAPAPAPGAGRGGFASGRGYGGGGGRGRGSSSNSGGGRGRASGASGFARRGGGGASAGGRGGRGAASGAAAGPVTMRMNSTNDEILSQETRAAMRDDGIVIANLLQLMPTFADQRGVLVTALAGRLRPEVQEALSEQHGGLLAFLQARRQLFHVVAREVPGADGGARVAYYVSANPLATKEFHTRELQRQTLRNMMGLTRAPADGGRGGRGGGGGGRGGGGGGGQRRPPPPSQQQRPQGRREGGGMLGGRGAPRTFGSG